MAMDGAVRLGIGPTRVGAHVDPLDVGDGVGPGRQGKSVRESLRRSTVPGDESDAVVASVAVNHPITARGEQRFRVGAGWLDDRSLAQTVVGVESHHHDRITKPENVGAVTQVANPDRPGPATGERFERGGAGRRWRRGRHRDRGGRSGTDRCRWRRSAACRQRGPGSHGHAERDWPVANVTERCGHDAAHCGEATRGGRRPCTEVRLALVRNALYHRANLPSVRHQPAGSL